MTDASACPDCGARGRRVERITLESLLTEDARARLDGASDYRFCKAEACDVVYYREGGGERFVSADVRVPVFQKSADPSRFVCYCFEHRVGEIEAEVARTGTSLVPDAIGEKCRQGLDRCEEMNPQGACCLENVRQVVEGAMAAAGSPRVASPAGGSDLCDGRAVATEQAATEDDCCGPAVSAVPPATAAGGRQRNVGLWSAGGAVVAAALSSACCWLPLALIAMGASAAGVGGFFEAYRAYFLGGTVVLLGAGFYFVYLRKPKCAPGEACEAPNPKLVRLNKIMLWTATAFVVAFAAFPNYVGALIGGADGTPPPVTASLSSRTYTIEGMTCEGCARHVREALEDIEGVASAEVSYADGVARVYLAEGADVSDSEVIRAVEAAGYRAAAAPPAGGRR